MSNLSRRSLVASAAALPALAVPAAAASIGNPDAEIVALNSQLARAWDIGLHDACKALSIAEEKVFEWQRCNPEPSKGNPSDDPQKSARINELVADNRWTVTSEILARTMKRCETSSIRSTVRPTS